MKIKIALAGLLFAVAVMSLPEAHSAAPEKQLHKKTSDVACFAKSEVYKIQSHIDAVKAELITFEKPLTYCAVLPSQPVNDFKKVSIERKLNRGPPSVIRI